MGGFGIVEHPCQYLGLVQVIFIVDPEIVSTMALVKAHHYGVEPIELDAFITVGAKDQWLVGLKEKGFFGLGGFFRKNFKSTIIKNVAVLVDLEERGTM